MQLDQVDRDEWAQIERRVRAALSKAGIATVATHVETWPGGESYLAVDVEHVEPAGGVLAIFHIEKCLGLSFGVYCDLQREARSGGNHCTTRSIVVKKVDTVKAKRARGRKAQGREIVR